MDSPNSRLSPLPLFAASPETLPAPHSSSSSSSPPLLLPAPLSLDQSWCRLFLLSRSSCSEPDLLSAVVEAALRSCDADADDAVRVLDAAPGLRQLLERCRLRAADAAHMVWLRWRECRGSGRVCSEPRRPLAAAAAAESAGLLLETGKDRSEVDAEVMVEEEGEATGWSGFRPRRTARTRCF